MLASNYISGLSGRSLAQILKQMALLYNSSTAAVPISIKSNKIHQLLNSSLKLNPSNCSECIFALLRPTSLANSLTANDDFLCRIDFIRYLGVNSGTNYYRASSIQLCIGKSRGLSLHIHKTSQLQTSQLVTLISAFSDSSLTIP